MIENYKEAFEKTRLAGTIASGALDEVAKIVKPELKLMRLISFVTSI